MLPINIFFHVATINNFEDIFNEIFKEIELSGLIDSCENIHISVVGNRDMQVPKHEKIKLIKNENISHGEFFTLQAIQDFCKEKNSHILYIHSKGATTPNNQCIIDWRKYMTYFNINQFKKCLNLLKTNDTCGVDLVQMPTTHYSGNFWWSKSEFINKLPLISEISKTDSFSILTTRHNAEFWICMKKGNHSCLHNSNINVYERHTHLYDKSNYICS